MPINIQYSPRAAEVANLAYQGGIGEYRKWLAEQQLRQDAMNQQAIQSQQHLAANLYNQQQNRLQDTQQFLAGRQFAQQQQERNIAADMALAQQRNQWAGQENQQQQNFALDRQQAAAGIQWEAQSAEQVEKQVDQLWNGYFNNRQQIPAEDQATFRGFASDLASIKKARGSHGPQAYAQALGEFAQNLEKSGLRERMTTPKTPRESADENTVTDDIRNPDTGEYEGRRVRTKTVRNGVEQWTSRFEAAAKPPAPAKATPDFSTPTAAGFAAWLKDNRKNFTTQDGEGRPIPAPIGELAQRYREEVEAAKKIETQSLEDYAKELEGQERQRGQSLLEQARAAGLRLPSDPMFGGQGYPWMQQSLPDAPPSAPPVQPAGFDPELPPPPPAVAPPQIPPELVPQPPSPAAPPPTALVSAAAPQPAVNPNAMDPEVLRRVTPARIAEAAKLGAPNPAATAALLAGIEVARERADAAKPKKPAGKSAAATVKDIPAADQALLDRLPRPRSKNDFDNLPQGAEFIAPDGSLRRK